MGTIRNPILPGFHPDPSMIFHDGWFYIANSTFEWFGGVEINRSKDLSVWEHVGRPLSTRRHLDMLGNPESGGIWAPCLTYADGLFWLIFTDVKTWADEPFKDAHNYVTTARDVKGPWSEPVFLNSSGFDPSLFHDDDGKKWYVNMEWDYRQPGTKKFTGILLQQFDPDSMSLTGPITKIFRGSEIGSVEGPHLYKKDGWYYLLTAEGGTVYEHAVSVARSRKIDGPYELHPENPLCSSRGDPSLYLQKAGHGSWCEGPDGKWFLAYLVGRPLPGTQRCVLGRETAIAELEWKAGWPYLKGGSNKPPATVDVPWSASRRKSENIEYRFTQTSSVEQDQFFVDFMTLRIPFDAERYSLDARRGFLRIFGRDSLISRHEQSLVARRQTDFSFRAETRVEFAPASFQEMAGLVYRYGERDWYYLRMSWNEKTGKPSVGILAMDNGHFSMPLGEAEPAFEGTALRLRAEVRYRTLEFSYMVDGGEWQRIGETFDASILSDEYGGLGFTGAFVGMACQDLRCRKAFADFEYFRYEALE